MIFNDVHFERFSRFILENYGIAFSQDKKDMLQTKLHKGMVKHRITSFDEYFRLIAREPDRTLVTEFTNEITVNKTDFFREDNHFWFLRDQKDLVLEKNRRILRNNEVRAWSAGCSSGEEPYTLSIVLKEHFKPGMEVKILGTDLSSRVLNQAAQARYPLSVGSQIQRYYFMKYFKREADQTRVVEEIRRTVTFRLFNLMDEFPFKKSFDMIFCRNVMIYFSSEVQQRLINKMYDVLVPGGLFFIGHSESLTGKRHKFQYVQPTIYMK